MGAGTHMSRLWGAPGRGTRAQGAPATLWVAQGPRGPACLTKPAEVREGSAWAPGAEPLGGDALRAAASVRPLASPPVGAQDAPAGSWTQGGL